MDKERKTDRQRNKSRKISKIFFLSEFYPVSSFDCFEDKAEIMITVSIINISGLLKINFAQESITTVPVHLTNLSKNIKKIIAKT